MTSPTEEFGTCVGVFLDLDQYAPGSHRVDGGGEGDLQLLRGHSLASQTAFCILGFPSGSFLLA